MKIQQGVLWGLIPARGGSKSIPFKNLAPLGGRPLIDYQVLAARASRHVERLVCDTDSERIADHCSATGVEVHRRDPALGADDTPVFDVVARFVQDIAAAEGAVPEMIALLQPTSPFLLPAHIDACYEELSAAPEAGSAQTVVELPHNVHAFNQREIVDGHVRFRFEAERRVAHNKQTKPRLWQFGNLLMFRVLPALEGHFLFPNPSLPVPIEKPHEMDADGPLDFQVAEAMMAAGLVRLDHLS